MAEPTPTPEQDIVVCPQTECDASCHVGRHILIFTAAGACSAGIRHVVEQMG